MENQRELIMSYSWKEYEEFANKLYRDQFCIIKFIDHQLLLPYQIQFMHTLEEFPEYNSKVKSYSIGTSGLLCNPGSFHNLMVREFRLNLMKLFVPLFRIFLKTVVENRLVESPVAEYKIEQLFGQMSYQRKDTEIYPEMPSAINIRDDYYYTGFLNFNYSDIKFSFINHKNEQVIINIPPGYLIVHNAKLQTCKTGQILDADLYTLGFNFRLTRFDSSLYGRSKVIEYQGVPFVQGKIPRMWDRLQLRVLGDKIALWSKKTFKYFCLDNDGRVDSILKSLKEYKCQMYPDYTKTEIEIMEPGIRFNIDGEELIFADCKSI